MKLLILTDCNYPDSAMGSRIKSFIYLFNSIGFDIHIIFTKFNENDFESIDYFNKNNISYQNVKSGRSEKWQSVLGNEKLYKYVKDYISNNTVNLVFMTPMGVNFKKIFKLLKQNNLKVILEQCEWFDETAYKYGNVDPRYIIYRSNFEKYYYKADGIVAISRLLVNHYNELGTKTIRIPSIFDVNNMSFSLETNNKKLKIIYAGSVGRTKEELIPILKGLIPYKDLIELDIYGIDSDTVLRNINFDKELLNENIFIHGRVLYKDLVDAFLKADYSIFIKPNKRSSQAQFPTKLAESMSYGTPVITNNTGDIGLYLKDGKNGYICDKNNISDTYHRILNDKNNNLRKKARETAIESFDYRNYIDAMKEFVNEI